MANEKVLLKAKANQLGIEGYRTMSVEELHKAIASAEGKHTVPAKGKTATASNGVTKGKGKSAAATTAKGKTSAAPAAPAKGKSNAQKTTQKASAAQGKASRAASTKGKTSTASKGKAKAKATPAKARKSTSAKKTTTATRSRKNAPARADIDRSAIDWRVETRIGASGKRKEVMDALKKHKGNYDKVFESLIHRAKSFYPGKSKHDAERLLRWLINRVAFDYVMATDQHTPGERTGYGQSDKPQDVRRREAREAARKESAKAERAAKRQTAPAKKAAKGKKTTASKKKTAARKR